MIEKIKHAAVPTLVIIAACLYFGLIGDGAKTPDALKYKG